MLNPNPNPNQEDSCWPLADDASREKKMVGAPCSDEMEVPPPVAASDAARVRRTHAHVTRAHPATSNWK